MKDTLNKNLGNFFKKSEKILRQPKEIYRKIKNIRTF